MYNHVTVSRAVRKLVTEWYQLQASLPVTSKVHQTYSAITGVKVMTLIDSPTSPPRFHTQGPTKVLSNSLGLVE